MIRQRGVTLLIAIIITGTLLLVATAIASVALKQSQLSSSNRESQYAFYAADSGIECAIYWDVKNPPGYSAFATSTTSQISCNGQTFVVGGIPSTTFTITYPPDPFCAKVTVTKNNDATTRIESLGYNTCDTSSPRRVERAVRVTY